MEKIIQHVMKMRKIWSEHKKHSSKVREYIDQIERGTLKTDEATIRWHIDKSRETMKVAKYMFFKLIKACAKCYELRKSEIDSFINVYEHNAYEVVE